MSLDTAGASDLRIRTPAVFERRITTLGDSLFYLIKNDQYIEYAPPSCFMVLPVINPIISMTLSTGVDLSISNV